MEFVNGQKVQGLAKDCFPGIHRPSPSAISGKYLSKNSNRAVGYGVVGFKTKPSVTLEAGWPSGADGLRLRGFSDRLRG